MLLATPPKHPRHTGSHAKAGPPFRPQDGDGDPKKSSTLSKTVMFEGKADLLAKVEAIKERTNGSISGTILTLIEAGLKMEEAGPGASDEVAISALPPWMRSALFEAARMTGHSAAGVVVDVLAKNLREYLAQARSMEMDMAKLLKPGSEPPPSPAQK